MERTAHVHYMLHADARFLSASTPAITLSGCAVTAVRQGGMCSHESIVTDPHGGSSRRCRRRRPRFSVRVTPHRFTAPAHPARRARMTARSAARDRGGGAISITLGRRHIQPMQPASHDVWPATSVHTEHESSHATLPLPGSRVHHVLVLGLQRRAPLGASPRSMTQTRSTRMRITEARPTGMADGVSALVMR